VRCHALDMSGRRIMEIPARQEGKDRHLILDVLADGQVFAYEIIR